jgi:hypothetical protein
MKFKRVSIILLVTILSVTILFGCKTKDSDAPGDDAVVDTQPKEKKLTIDGIETIMLKTMETLKHNVIATAEEIMNEEGKKKPK